jgi:hypothetical protein
MTLLLGVVLAATAPARPLCLSTPPSFSAEELRAIVADLNAGLERLPAVVIPEGDGCPALRTAGYVELVDKDGERLAVRVEDARRNTLARRDLAARPRSTFTIATTVEELVRAVWPQLLSQAELMPEPARGGAIGLGAPSVVPSTGPEAPRVFRHELAVRPLAEWQPGHLTLLGADAEYQVMLFERALVTAGVLGRAVVPTGTALGRVSGSVWQGRLGLGARLVGRPLEPLTLDVLGLAEGGAALLQRRTTTGEVGSSPPLPLVHVALELRLGVRLSGRFGLAAAVGVGTSPLGLAIESPSVQVPLTGPFALRAALGVTVTL